MHARPQARFVTGQAVRVEARDRKRLEQLCRYTTRPALSDRRVQLNDAGQVELKLKTPWRDGVMSPLEFMQRLIRLHSALRQRGTQDHRGHSRAAGDREDLTYLGLDPQPPARGRAREAGHDFAA